MLARVVAVLVVLLGLLGGAASASPRQDILGCGDTDPPFPASPYGDGSFIVNPSGAVSELPAGWEPGQIVEATDAFRNAGEVSLESVYGTAPQWWTYEAGCTGQFVAGAGTALGNIVLQISGILPSWSHALLGTVIGDSDLFAALDVPIEATTAAVSAGVWEPWLPVAILLVGGLVLWRARSGRLGGAVTAAGTALGVLALTSMLIRYPTESVDMVDTGVRSGTGLIAAGFSGGRVLPEGSGTGDPAAAAIDAQMDDIVRTTQFRTWVTGVFGDPDSQTAKTYGPRVFRATHFSWAEYAIYRHDPTGEGQEILEAKQAAFKQHAEQVKRADPVAYEHFTGRHWDDRVTAALVNLLVVCIPCVFLLLAALIAVMGFVVVRLVVPLAPAAGVIFLFDNTRDIAVGWLKRVVGPLVMGPVCLLAALILLRFTSAILDTEEIWWVLKIGLILVLTAVAWRQTRPFGVVPGAEQIRTRLVGALGQVLGSTIGAAHGAREGLRSADAAYGDPRLTGAGGRPSLETSPGGVYQPAFEARSPSASLAEPPDDFVPYTPSRSPSGWETFSAREMGEVAARRALPSGPSFSDRGLREEYQQLPAEKKDRWVPLPGYPTGGTALDKAHFYADQLNRDDLDLPEWQRNVVAGRWFNFAVADQYRATEVTINKYEDLVDPATGEIERVKVTNFFLDGLGFDGEVGSNKYCQVADLKPATWYGYVNEFNSKYDTGRKDLVIADTPSVRRSVARGDVLPYEVGRPLNGEKVLRVPRQDRPIPRWAHDYADAQGVTIEETDTHPDAGELS